MKDNASYGFWFQLATILVIFITMILIWRQTNINAKEFKVKNKPVVGIEGADLTFLIPANDPRVGKPVYWNESEKKIFCEGTPISIQALVLNIKIRNFGSEPALDLTLDSEIIIGETSIKTRDPENKNAIIMPGQAVFNKPQINSSDLMYALLRKNKIRLKLIFKYSDLTRSPGLFESQAEILIWDLNEFSSRIIDGFIKDNRF